MPLDTWTHVAVVLASPTNRSLYLDGTFVQQDTTFFDLGPASGAMATIGNTADEDDPWHGFLDDLRLFDRVLSESEINDVMGTPSPECADGLDNDSDGLTDYPADPGCIDAADGSETDPPPNQAPTADAGSDQTVTDFDNDGSATVTLNGAGSSDADGTIVSYLWDDNGTVLADTSSPTVAVSLTLGLHTITLIVTDDDGASDTDTMVVAVVTPRGDRQSRMARRGRRRRSGRR